MSWEYKIAKRLKDDTDRSKRKAIDEASFYVGKIEKLSPVTVSAMDGELMYTEGDDLLVTRTVKDYGRDVTWPVATSHVPGTATREKFLAAGMTVLLAPVGGADIMAIIDILED